MANLWKAFEHWLVKRFPEATTLATPFNDPAAHSVEEYQLFLKSINYTQLRKRLLERKYRDCLKGVFYETQQPSASRG